MTGIIVINEKDKARFSLKITKLTDKSVMLSEGSLLRILPNGQQYRENDRVEFMLLWEGSKVWAYIKRLTKRQSKEESTYVEIELLRDGTIKESPAWHWHVEYNFEKHSPVFSLGFKENKRIKTHSRMICLRATLEQDKKWFIKTVKANKHFRPDFEIKI